MNPKKHNRRVKAVTTTIIVVAILSIMAIDSASWVPCISLGASLLYIFLFYVANK